MNSLKELEYPDTCVIYAKNNEDELDDDGFVKESGVIYDGVCDYQSKGNALDGGIITSNNAKLYLPYDEALYQITNGQITADCRVEITRNLTESVLQSSIKDCYAVNVYNRLVGICIELNEVTFK